MRHEGTFSLHGSLLPQYRGYAAPINWAVINGERTETGGRDHASKKEIDTGQLIYNETTPISEDDTAGTVRQVDDGNWAYLVLKTVRAIEANDYPQVPQPERRNKARTEDFQRDCEIIWKKSTDEIFNFVHWAFRLSQRGPFG
jgi:methionyl-tRNA formyltransferase